MGSSLGLALKNRRIPVEVRAYARRQETREEAVRLGVADDVLADPVDAVRGVDLVVLCVPVQTIPALASACRDGLKAGAVITDVGSTKACLNVEMAEALAGSDAVFVGSHPICGSEQQGIESGSPDLYDGAVTVVTPQDGTSPELVAMVSNLWTSVGSVVRIMNADAHDAALAMTSHLPHVIAAALVLSAGEDGSLSGTGFRDTTRIADGSPDVWSDVVCTNRAALLDALDGFQNHLNELRTLVANGDDAALRKWFASAREKRRALQGASSSQGQKGSEPC